MTRKKQILRYSCLALSLLCGLFLSVSFVFAASRQSPSFLATVKYDPEIKAVVQVKVGSADYKTLFNNTGETVTNNTPSPNFKVSTSDLTGFNSSDPVQFKVTNYSNQPISALVRLATAADDMGDVSNIYLYNDDNFAIENNSLKINSVISGTVNNDKISAYVQASQGVQESISSAESQAFYIQTLFTDTIVPLVVELHGEAT